MVHIKRQSRNTPSSSKKKFDKNRSFSGVESKNKSPNKRRKSIAAVLPTPVKHQVKKTFSNEWTIINENLNNEEVPLKKKKGLFIDQQGLNEQATPLLSHVKKNSKPFVSESISKTTPIDSVKSRPKSIKKKINRALEEIENQNTNTSISPTVKVSKGKKKSNSNTEDKKSVNKDLLKKASLHQLNISDKSKAPQAKESIKHFKKRVKPEDIEKAIKGVIKFRSENPKLKNKLFTDCYPLFLQVSCVKLPMGCSKILRIPLPHSVLTPDNEACLIVPDVKGIKNIEHEKHVEHYEDLLRKKEVTNIKKIMTFHELRTEYETFEQKSRLVDLYDIFLVDGKICGKATQKCGKVFYKRRKVPIPIKLQATKLKENIEKALSKVFFFLHLKGDTYTVQFGHDQMETEKLIENVYSVIEFLEKAFPGGFENIKGIQAYAQRATSIPIYLNFKSPNEVTVPGVKPRQPRAYKTYKDELTTLHDAVVTVKPTGEVLVERGKNKTKKGDDVITDSDLIQTDKNEKNSNEDGERKNKSRKRKQNTKDAVTEHSKKPKLLEQEGASPEEKLSNKKLSKSTVKDGNSKTKVKTAKVKKDKKTELLIDTEVNVSKIKKVKKVKKNNDVAKIEKVNKKKKNILSA